MSFLVGQDKLVYQFFNKGNKLMKTSEHIQYIFLPAECCQDHYLMEPSCSLELSTNHHSENSVALKKTPKLKKSLSFTLTEFLFIYHYRAWYKYLACNLGGLNFRSIWMAFNICLILTEALARGWTVMLWIMHLRFLSREEFSLGMHFNSSTPQSTSLTSKWNFFYHASENLSFLWY